MGGPSLEVMELGDHLIKRLGDRPTALDLGSGTGRNSLFLSSLGFDILAIERDEALASHCSNLLIQNGYEARVECMNVTAFKPLRKFDLCLCLGILHFLELREAKDLVQRLKTSTSPQGFHVLTIADRIRNRGRCNTLPDQNFLGTISANDIKRWYADWHLLAYERYTKTDDHLAGKLDEHVIEKFVVAPLAAPYRNELFPRTWKLRAESTPNLKTTKLHQLVRFRVHWKQLEAQIGRPADLEIVSNSPHAQLSIAPNRSGSFSLRVAFWGTLKLYLENDRLVGFSRYQTDTAHSFAGFE